MACNDVAVESYFKLFYARMMEHQETSDTLYSKVRLSKHKSELMSSTFWLSCSPAQGRCLC